LRCCALREHRYEHHLEYSMHCAAVS
jgi:hypothetical protein